MELLGNPILAFDVEVAAHARVKVSGSTTDTDRGLRSLSLARTSGRRRLSRREVAYPFAQRKRCGIVRDGNHKTLQPPVFGGTARLITRS
jgi:hypothetical protein